MIDQLLGRPSPTVRTSETYLVLFFWIWRLYKGSAVRVQSGRRHNVQRYNLAAVTRNQAWWRRVWSFLVARDSGKSWMTSINHRLKHFTPYQLVVGTFTLMYAFRHLDDLLGVAAPDPMAGMYSRSFYRATWINTALDAGFASAMAVRPKWAKDIMSLVFAAYYLIFAEQGDEVLRRWRALCSVEMLRTTWEKTNNPYIRFLTRPGRASLQVVRNVSIARPSTSSRAKLPPVAGLLLFNGSEAELAKATELIVDFPGGGFVAMGPECHEERLRIWAKRTGKPVLSINYGKAPEYPYPWAIEEGIDAYRTITDSKGDVLGIKSGKLRVVLTGDSAGGNICTTIMNRILEHHKHIDRPVAMILAYPALDFNYTSWMTPANLKVLKTEQSETHIPGLALGKDHLAHKSPLSVVDDVGKRPRRPPAKSRKSWADSITGKFGITMTPTNGRNRPSRARSTPGSPVMHTHGLPRSMSKRGSGWFASHGEMTDSSAGGMSDSEDSETDDEQHHGNDRRSEAEKSLAERVKTPGVHADERFTEGILAQSPVAIVNEDEAVPVKVPMPVAKARKAPIGSRLTMTSRVGYFQDRIITPSMMRAMAILYIGPQACPDFETDYYISPILSPSKNLAYFPPVYLISGERDPFVDDTVLFAGRLREAKRTRRSEAESKSTKSGAPAPPNRPSKFGENLRLTTGAPAAPAAATDGKATIPDHIVRETDDDWVQMRIIEGWGHGFMQMTTLMREVESVLIEMADWIDESFERDTLLQKEDEDIKAVHAAARAAFTPEGPVQITVQDPMPSPLRSRHVKPAREYKQNPTGKALGGADLGGMSGLDDDNDGMISFTPKSKRRTPPSSQFIPVPRRSSRDSLTRNNSVPRFDDDSGSSGETMSVSTPTDAFSLLPVAPPRGGGTFAFFGSRPVIAGPKPTVKSAATALYGPQGRKVPDSSGMSGKAPNPLVAAAVASAARAASPALAAAGLVPQSVQNVSQAELMRRRRQEMVAGMGETHSAQGSDRE